MSSKRLTIFTALIVVFAAAITAFAGCKIGQPTAQDILDDNQMTANVIYYANEGRFENSSRTRSIYFRADTPVINIKQEAYIEDGDPSNVYVNYTNYVLEGWYYAELDDNNSPVFTDADGNTLHMHVFTAEDADIEIPKDEYSNPLTGFDNEAGELVFKSLEEVFAKATDRRVDFSQKIGDNDSWHFVAKWVEDVKLEYVLVSDAPVTVGETTYENGSVIYEASFGRYDSLSISINFPVNATGSTFLQAYEDEQCTVQATRVQKPTDGQNVRVYAKFIQGEWRVVRSPQDVSSMFISLNMPSTQFYIFNDIDCSNISIAPNSGNFSCTIEGNGHKLSNLNFALTNINTDANVSMLGSLTSTAKISNITFENVKVSLETRSRITVEGLYLVCGGIEDGAVLSGVEFNNVSLTFGDARRQTEILNIPRTGDGEDAVYNTDNWMFGGLGTDAAFIQQHGVTVNGRELIVILDRNNTKTLFSAPYAE